MFVVKICKKNSTEAKSWCTGLMDQSKEKILFQCRPLGLYKLNPNDISLSNFETVVKIMQAQKSKSKVKQVKSIQ